MLPDSPSTIPRPLDDAPERRVHLQLEGFEAFAVRIAGMLRTLALPRYLSRSEHVGGPDEAAMVGEAFDQPLGLWPSPVLLTGDWGSGKTTVLRMVQRELELSAPTAESRRDWTWTAPSRSVWFEAWRHADADGLLPGLVRAVWASMPADRAADRRDTALLGCALAAAEAVGRHAVDGAASSVGLPGLRTLFGRAATSQSVLAGYVGVAEAELPTLGAQEVLLRLLARILRHGWPLDPDRGGEFPDGVPRVPVVFIDDLDRCSPDQAMALLDQVRFLVSDDRLPCVFVFAMDRAILTQAVRFRYAKLPDYDGNRFLEKLFPMSFRVPEPSHAAVEGLVGALLGDSEEGQSHAHAEALCAALSSPIFANPRLIKRVINAYRLVLAFEGSTAPDPCLADWLAATQRWPNLRSLMARRDAGWWARLGEAARRPTPPPQASADIRALVTDPLLRDWLSRHLFGTDGSLVDQLRRADGRLRRWGL
ncbi:MAG: hypothetical protein ACI8PZ_003229 [Myxococcota bacterium]